MVARPRHANATAGFTLAELLVASILLTIVMTSVYTMFYAVLVPWRAVENDYDAFRETRNAMTLIEREVHNLTPAAAHLFEGEKDEVTLFAVTEPMDVEKSEGRHLMRVRYRFNKAGEELIREEALVTTPLPVRPPEGRELDRNRVKVKQKRDFVVAGNVEDFAIRYVWLPAPKQRDAKAPPAKIQPLYANKQKERWGYPQGVEITLKLRDPEKKDSFQTVTKLIPLNYSTWRSIDDLTKRLGSALSS